MNLQTFRNKINKIDAKIINLLLERRSVSVAIGKYKKENNIAINHPKREKEILDVVDKPSRPIFKAILKDSKDLQKKLK